MRPTRSTAANFASFVPPLVSIFMFVRNGAPSIRRAVDSVLAQTYCNIEFVVQDGASTDGTLEILQSYGDRLKLQSEPDSGPTEGFWRALDRCNGEIISCCLADEELLPDAVGRAVRVLEDDPEIGATTGDALVTDVNGKPKGLWTSGPFNLVDYLTVDYSPYLVSSFFRRSTLRDVGLSAENCGPLSVEFELWCRLATHSRIKYIPGVFAKYASHPGQLSNTSKDVLMHVQGRMNFIVGLCEPGGFFDDQPLLRNLFIWGHARAFCNHALNIGRAEMALEEYKLMMDTLAAHPPVFLDGVQYDPDYAFRLAAIAAWNRTGRHLPRFALGFLLPGSRGAARATFVERLVERRYLGRGDWFSVLKALLGSKVPKSADEIRTPPPLDRKLKARLYTRMALCFEARGLHALAAESFRFAAVAADLYVPDDDSYRADRKQGWSEITS